MVRLANGDYMTDKEYIAYLEKRLKEAEATIDYAYKVIEKITATK